MSKQQSKQKLVAAAADLLRRRGLQATSVRELAKHAGAPLGSVYHYFPGGKAEFVADAVTFTGGQVEKQLADCLALGPLDGFKRYFAQWRTVLLSSGYAAGCPLAAISMDAQAKQDAPEALIRVSKVFHDLRTQIAVCLQAEGLAQPQAEQLATTIIAITEGAILICRANQDLDALEVAESSVLSLLSGSLISSASEA
ncbi:TetR/AcrR family transcriptional regulator [Rheinheimera texasensis]|uniref:TetR/AcrR family transcriptional regulator n=1 Tax=Rheinheimera texasensis TaxID=306205 RepID=UPI0004E0CDB8|nr:TetR/AcrR family transcriptional regulator [Rheinheimera texasensis]